MIATLDHTEDVAKNIKTFWFKPARPLKYVAGQYIEMSLPHTAADARGQKHWFTLSSSPSEGLIAITTKHASGQVSTFKQTLFALKPGARVTISEPMGDFVLPKDASISLVFVAGGIGVTPIRSIIKWLADQNEKRQIHVIYGAQTLEEVAFRELIEAYDAKLDIVLSGQPGGPWRSGRLSGELILELAGRNNDALFFVSGPEPLVEQLETDLKAGGIDSSRLVLDFYPGYLAN